MWDGVDREGFALPRAAAAETEIFAIGDAHGRADLIEALLAAAARVPRRAARRELVFLGDLIDRGPDNLGAIRLALEAGEIVGADRVVRLMGNHEILMRLALDPTTPADEAFAAFAHWTRNGGLAVVDEILPGFDGDIYEAFVAVRQSAPAFVRQWLDGLCAHHRSHDLLFVHAGLHPGAPLESYLATPWNTPLAKLDGRRHWAWVRGPFLGAEPGPEGFSGLFVVHGHSPLDLGFTRTHAERIARFRLNLDAGSGKTGRLHLGLIRADRAEVWTARGARNDEL